MRLPLKEKVVPLALIISLSTLVAYLTPISEGAAQSANTSSFSTSLYAPCRIAVDQQGNIYVTEPRKGSIVVYRPWGGLKDIKKHLGTPVSIAIDRNGAIYVGDQEKGNVTAFDPSWHPLRKLGSGDGEFSLPNDICIEPVSRHIYVTDSKNHVVKVYEPTGDKITEFGGFGDGNGQLNFPTGISVDAARGEVLVGDYNNGRIAVFDLSGSWTANLGSYGGGEGRFTRVQGLAVGADGNIYAADAFQSVVQVIDRTGSFISFIGKYGSAAGRLKLPMDVVIDANNRLLVSSTNNSRIEVFALENSTEPEPVIEATITIRPKTISKFDQREFITCYIEIPGYDLNQVDVSSILLAETVRAETSPLTIGDYDEDGILDLAVNLSKQDIVDNILPGKDIIVTVGGRINGEYFEGADSISITAQDPPRVVTASVFFKPRKVKQRKKDKRVKCYIETPGYDLSQVDISSVMLNDIVPALPIPGRIGDRDRDRVPDLRIYFSSNEVAASLPSGKGIVVTIKGKIGRDSFEGTTAVNVRHRKQRKRK